MTVFEQHNAIEKALKSDLYAMYLRKSRADIELEALGEGETLAKHKTMLYALAARHDTSLIFAGIILFDSFDPLEPFKYLSSNERISLVLTTSSILDV